LPLGDGRSLLGATFDRARRLAPASRIFAVVAAPLVDLVRQELPELPPENILGEPCARNTAAAIGLAARVAEARVPGALLAVLPADHAIRDEDSFAETAQAALSLAAAGEVVTIGISPTRAETGYGYLHMSPETVGARGRLLRRFVEKPNAEDAARFVSSGEFLWNSGTFFFSAARLLGELRAHLPVLAQGLDEIHAESATQGLERALAAHFPRLPSISIDYGIMEKLPRVVTVPGSFDWDDIGTLDAYAALPGASRAPLEVGASGNRVIGGARRVVVLGVDDLLIAERDHFTLICRRQDAQRVREVVAALESQGEPDAL
jgi:mannose-1-phosphate guanylyltransferase